MKPEVFSVSRVNCSYVIPTKILNWVVFACIRESMANYGTMFGAKWIRNGRLEAAVLPKLLGHGHKGY